MPGTSECLVHHVVCTLRDAGFVNATFGAGVREAIEIVDNIKAVRAKFLSAFYNAIVNSFNLANKSRYRFVVFITIFSDAGLD